MTEMPAPRPNTDRYFVRWTTNSCDEIETEYPTEEARFRAYAHCVRAGRTVAAFDLSTRWGHTVEMPVLIYLSERDLQGA